MHKSSRAAGARPLVPTVRSFGVLDRLSTDILVCPTLRISSRARTPKRCSVGASPNRTGLTGPEPENPALENNDNWHSSECQASIASFRSQNRICLALGVGLVISRRAVFCNGHLELRRAHRSKVPDLKRVAQSFVFARLPQVPYVNFWRSQGKRNANIQRTFCVWHTDCDCCNNSSQQQIVALGHVV